MRHPGITGQLGFPLPAVVARGRLIPMRRLPSPMAVSVWPLHMARRHASGTHLATYTATRSAYIVVANTCLPVFTQPVEGMLHVAQRIARGQQDLHLGSRLQPQRCFMRDFILVVHFARVFTCRQNEPLPSDHSFKKFCDVAVVSTWAVLKNHQIRERRQCKFQQTIGHQESEGKKWE